MQEGGLSHCVTRYQKERTCKLQMRLMIRS